MPIKPALLLMAISLWANLVLGVSLIAASAKFLAPSLSLAVALDVGKHTFHVLLGIEWTVAMIISALVLSVGYRNVSRVNLVLIGLAVLILVTDSFVLIPTLDLRVDTIMAGGSVPPSQLHIIYIVLDVLKIILLSTLAWRIIRCGGLADK